MILLKQTEVHDEIIRACIIALPNTLHANLRVSFCVCADTCLKQLISGQIPNIYAHPHAVRHV
jgi:hypothetical protein